MDSKNRMDGCVCANGAKVAEIVHPYCPAHVPPEMEAELASLRAEVERLKAEHSQVAGALGCVHEQSMGECHAGTVDDMLCAIATLRGEIVILHSANARGASMVNEINVERAAFARRLGDALGISEDDSIIAAIEKLRADLARVEAERDEARALIEQWTLDLARLGEERDEARVEVARLTMELAGSLHISRADARELIEESETSTSEECYARARSALRAYAGSGFECHVQNPLDAALKRIVEVESERDALSADLAESEATLEPLRLALGEHIGRIEALVRRAPPVPTNAKREDDEYEDVCATPDVIGELRRHGHDDTADLVESLVGIGPRPFAYSDPVADFEHQRRCTEDARIVAIVREWGAGGHELPSRLRNNGDYTTAALVEALRGVIGGSDA